MKIHTFWGRWSNGVKHLTILDRDLDELLDGDLDEYPPIIGACRNVCDTVKIGLNKY